MYRFSTVWFRLSLLAAKYFSTKLLLFSWKLDAFFRFKWPSADAHIHLFIRSFYLKQQKILPFCCVTSKDILGHGLRKSSNIKTFTRTIITAWWVKCAQIHICTFCFALFSRLTFKLKILNPTEGASFQHFNPAVSFWF